MKIVVFDCEVFLYDWLFVFKDTTTKQYTYIHNDPLELRNFLNDDDIILCGFNSKHYDNYIAKAIVYGATNEEVKEINDFIIKEGQQGWEHPFFTWKKTWFKSFDLFDDMQDGMSLKAIEAHLGMNIVESEVDFDIQRPLTEEEIKMTFKYCKTDVDATEVLLKKRKKYLSTKIKLGRMRGIPDDVSLSCTNAKIVAKYLMATATPRNDGRDYVYPPNLDLSVIPQEIIDFFETIHDESIPEKQLFKTSLKIKLGTCPCKFAWGGVHGSETKYYAEANDEWIIQNRDVSSLYPSLAIIYDYISRNSPSPELFIETYHTRINAKHTGDTETAGTLKLPLNTYTGAMENQYNDLYDPLKPRSIRISGQLFITELIMKLLKACSSIRFININTDGIMYKIKKSELSKVDAICSEWEKRTGLELETDEIAKVWIKDVNNLLIIETNGKIKKVGGYLNYGINDKGAWSVNNNYVIVKKALYNYFVYGKPVEDTINESTDILDFQIIAKAGSSYKEASYTISGVRQTIQKVNRVYATNNVSYGTIKKRKDNKVSDDKIGNLPDHVLIDNDNHLSISDVYKGWYIEKAKKYIADYTIKPERKKITNIKNKILNML